MNNTDSKIKKKSHGLLCRGFGCHPGRGGRGQEGGVTREQSGSRHGLVLWIARATNEAHKKIIASYFSKTVSTMTKACWQHHTELSGKQGLGKHRNKMKIQNIVKVGEFCFPWRLPDAGVGASQQHAGQCGAAGEAHHHGNAAAMARISLYYTARQPRGSIPAADWFQWMVLIWGPGVGAEHISERHGWIGGGHCHKGHKGNQMSEVEVRGGHGRAGWGGAGQDGQRMNGWEPPSTHPCCVCSLPSLAKIVQCQPEHIVGTHPGIVNVLQEEHLVEAHDGVLVGLHKQRPDSYSLIKLALRQRNTLVNSQPPAIIHTLTYNPNISVSPLYLSALSSNIEMHYMYIQRPTVLHR